LSLFNTIYPRVTQAVDVAAASLLAGNSVDLVSKELGDLALQLGSRDNITVMVLLLDGVRGLPPLESPTMGAPPLLLDEPAVAVGGSEAEPTQQEERTQLEQALAQTAGGGSQIEAELDANLVKLDAASRRIVEKEEEGGEGEEEPERAPTAAAEVPAGGGAD